jgi:hypothetical protein
MTTSGRVFEPSPIAIDVHGLKFLTRPDVHQPDGLVLLQPFDEVPGIDQNLFILFVAAADVVQNFGHIEVAVPLANLSERFLQTEPATAAPADVIPAEQSPLRPREGFEHIAHRGLRVNCFSHRLNLLHGSVCCKKQQQRRRGFRRGGIDAQRQNYSSSAEKFLDFL